MGFEFCPGAERFKHPQPEVIRCPYCKEEAEIWTDEFQIICPNCKKPISRQSEASCLEWCEYAKECVGERVYNNFLKNKNITIKEKLLKELEDYFSSDLKRINHAKKVMGFAEELLKQEKADWHIVIPASILHDIGIKAAEEKYGNSAGHYQEKEGPKIARGILLKLGFKKEDINEICEIIAHHHTPSKIDTQNFKVLYDADLLVNLNDEADVKDKAKLDKIIDNAFLTQSGKKLAARIYL